MKLSGSTSSNEALTITTTEIETGKARLDTFTIKANGYISESLPIGASSSQVGQAVKRLFGANCPSQLEKSIGNGMYR